MIVLQFPNSQKLVTRLEVQPIRIIRASDTALIRILIRTNLGRLHRWGGHANASCHDRPALGSSKESG
jgi:hypothetical protein